MLPMSLLAAVAARCLLDTHSMIRNHHTVAAATTLALLLGAGLSTPAAAGQSVGASLAAMANPAESTDRLIVKMRDRSPATLPARIDALGLPHGVKLSYFRQMSGGSEVVRMNQRLSHAEAQALARRLERDPNVVFAEPDRRLYPQATAPQLVPNDTRYAEQWHYYEAAGGINLPAAWYVTTGSSSIVVAVIDTGVRSHAELDSRVLPGYDFIGDLAVANDGSGRDADASDPGDYGCGGRGASSWHGTHVAGTIGAASNNGAGVAGVNWTSKILPVRVLGVCGGYTSDIVDGLRWAAGIPVAGVPANPTPARVANLSLGGSGTCSATFQNAINDVVARGTVVTSRPATATSTRPTRSRRAAAA